MNKKNESDRNIRKLGFFIYPLIGFFLLIGIVFFYSHWLPDSVKEQLTNATGLTDQFLYFFGMVFLTLSLLLYTGFHNLRVESATVRLIGGLSDIVGKNIKLIDRILGILEKQTGAEEKKQVVEDKTELDSFRHNLEGIIRSNVKEAESRLRSEWRFVLGLIITILLAVITLFAAR